MTTTVDYAELTRSPQTEDWGRGGAFRATRVLRCKYADRHQLANELLGMWGVGSPAFYAPEAYPGVPGSRVTGVQITHEVDLPLNTALPMTFETAILTVAYETGLYSVGTGGTYFEESLDTSAEVMSVDSEQFWRRVPGGPAIRLTVPESPQRIIRQVEWNLTIYNVASLPVNLINAVGSCNSAQVVSPTLGIPFGPECLQYVGCSPSRTVGSAGTTAWKVGLKFVFRNFSWNKFFHKTNPNVPDYLYTDQALAVPWLPYPPINFTTALTLP